jgi:hypothetical protein
MEDKVVGINLGRRDQLKPGGVWDALRKVIQSNDRFGLRDGLEFYLDNVRKPAGNGVVKSYGHFLDVLRAVKKGIIVVKVARVNGVPKYKFTAMGIYWTKLLNEY